MSVPKSVQRDADRVAQIEQAMAAQAAPVEVAAPEPPEPQQELSPPVVEPPAPPPQPPEPDYKQKYLSLQGIFNKEVPALQSKLRDALDRIQQLEKPPETKPDRPQADPKDVQEFGADLVDMVGRVAERMFGSMAKAFDERLKQLEAKLNSTGQAVTQTAEQAFFTALERAVPEWETINADQRFLDWLQETDPLTGEPRQAMLSKAHAALDARRAAAFFQVWKAENAPPVAAAPPAPPARPLKSQVTPSTTPASPPPAQPAKPVITQAHIQRVYNDYAQGKYRGRQADFEAAEREINLALTEGRIV